MLGHVQDGSIEYQIKLTGELSTNPLSPGEDPKNPEYGTLVDHNVNAQVRACHCNSTGNQCLPALSLVEAAHLQPAITSYFQQVCG